MQSILYESVERNTHSSMKNLLIAAAVIAAPSAAIAGPYVELEANAGFTGSSYDGAVVETHVGYASDLGDASSFYIQAGPAFLLPNDGDICRAPAGALQISHQKSGTSSSGRFGGVFFLSIHRPILKPLRTDSLTA